MAMLVITRGYIPLKPPFCWLNPIKPPLNHHFPMVFLWLFCQRLVFWPGLNGSVLLSSDRLCTRYLQCRWGAKKMLPARRDHQPNTHGKHEPLGFSVCIYIFVYICIYTCIYIYIHMCMYIYMYVYVSVHIRICTIIMYYLFNILSLVHLS